VRLAFLDVLQSEHAGTPGQSATPMMVSDPGLPVRGSVVQPTVAYPAAAPPASGVNGWLRRNAGLLGLLAILLVAGLIGLLVGHWVSGGNGQQVVKVEYPNGLPTAASNAPAAATPSTPAPASAASAPKGSKAQPAASSHEPENEAAEEHEAQEIESKPPPAAKPKTASHGTLKHIESSTGKKHAEEVNNLASGEEPIETGH
jgi:predicted lipid-binding transport protein (Tim44 family)